MNILVVSPAYAPYTGVGAARDDEFDKIFSKERADSHCFKK